MMQPNTQFSDGTSAIIGAAIEVHRALGPGLLESTYEKCLAYKLDRMGIPVRRQVPIALRFEQLLIVDAYRIDLIVDEKVVVEVKARENLSGVHFSQVVTYLRLTKLRVGLLLNFHSVHLRDGIHRIVNDF
jgi:GxxExxY protein